MSTDTQVAIEAGDTLENLVNQFTDPYACLRELIQNAMDAGSSTVDVWFEFNPYERSGGNKGIMILHVDDTGEGMNRNIIDSKLTQLFSSSKEDDLTKVGKFGIGFVSVFALEPDAVIVDTGRDGEYWRLIFKKDRRFDRILLNHPVEGTQIQLVKEVTLSVFERMKARSLETIRYWCKHVEADITVDGERVNEPFRIGHPHEYIYRGNETEIAVAPSSDEEPFFGFYNRGLTLREGHALHHRGAAFKISSRYLEHTLTRDNVITDNHYDKAMKLLADIVEGPFRKQLFEKAAATFDYELFGALADRFGRKLPSEYENMPLLPTVHGDRVSIATVARAARRAKMVMYSSERSGLTDRVREHTGHPILLWEGPEQQPGLEILLARIDRKAPLMKAEEVWAAPELIASPTETQKRLLGETSRLMNRLKSPYRSLSAADFGRHSPALADSLYIEQVNAGELVFVSDYTRARPRNWKNFLLGFARGKVLLVNVTHPLLEPHFRLYDQRPTLAAYLMTKAITIDDGLDPQTEEQLLQAAFEMER